MGEHVPLTSLASHFTCKLCSGRLNNILKHQFVIIITFTLGDFVANEQKRTSRRLSVKIIWNLFSTRHSVNEKLVFFKQLPFHRRVRKGRRNHLLTLAIGHNYNDNDWPFMEVQRGMDDIYILFMTWHDKGSDRKVCWLLHYSCVTSPICQH